MERKSGPRIVGEGGFRYRWIGSCARSCVFYAYARRRRPYDFRPYVWRPTMPSGSEAVDQHEHRAPTMDRRAYRRERATSLCVSWSGNQHVPVQNPRSAGIFSSDDYEGELSSRIDRSPPDSRLKSLIGHTPSISHSPPQLYSRLFLRRPLSQTDFFSFLPFRNEVQLVHRPSGAIQEKDRLPIFGLRFSADRCRD